MTERPSWAEHQAHDPAGLHGPASCPLCALVDAVCGPAQAPEPCSYRGAHTHWRPDCPEAPRDECPACRLGSKVAVL